MSWTLELKKGAIGVAAGPLLPDKRNTAKVSLVQGTDFLEVELTEAEAAEFVTELASRFGKRYEKAASKAVDDAIRVPWIEAKAKDIGIRAGLQGPAASDVLKLIKAMGYATSNQCGQTAMEAGASAEIVGQVMLVGKVTT